MRLDCSLHPDNVRRQLSRWVSAGRKKQLRRVLYTLALPYQKDTPHPFLAADALVTGSDVSGQSAMAHYDLIFEYVPLILSITTSRPGGWAGGFYFRHIAPQPFFDYQSVQLPKDQNASVATPEKALLDPAHLTRIPIRLIS